MEEKIKVIEQVITLAGLSREDVIAYWIRQGKVKTEAAQENLQNVKNRSVVNLYFPADDIRSRTKLFWYAFEGGKFSPDPKAYPNCQGVVGWINPDPNAPEGKRIYVVLPEQQKLQYSDKDYETRVTDLYDGKANTRNLVEYGKKHNIEFPAAEYAYNYCKNGVKQGEAFLPARKQLRLVVSNSVDIKESLKLIGGTFEGWLWSSSEFDRYNAWDVSPFYNSVCNDGKRSTYLVNCFISY